MQPSHEELALRLARLERQNRTTKRVALGLATVLAGSALTLGVSAFKAPKKCRTIWGERIVLRDSMGRDRMVFDAYSSAVPTLTLSDHKGKDLAAIEVQNDGGLGLKVFQEGRAKAASFRVNPDGSLGFGCPDAKQACDGKATGDGAEPGID